MGKLTPLELPPWALPALVIVIVLPAVAGFLLAGPALGMAGGALSVTAIAVAAARLRYDEPIEVARSAAQRYHLLVVATATIDSVAAMEIEERVEEAAQIAGVHRDDAVDVLVLSPVLNRGLSHWASDLGTAMVKAQERLVVSLATLAAASVGGRGEIGDADPVQATEDTLRTFPAQEVLLVEESGGGRRVIDELRRRLDRPLRRVEVDQAKADPRATDAA